MNGVNGAAGFDLSGRVALVTGGSRGLGQSIVLSLAHAGADVLIVSRKLESCRAVAKQVARETGRRAVPYSCHVGRWEEVDELAKFAYDEFGRIDVLVNNAGMSPLYDEVQSVSEELWRKVMDVNLTGPFRLTALIGSRMAAGGGGGSIINVSSVAALHPSSAEIPYAAAKAGLNAITIGFARALGPTVRVNCIVAGTFLTDIADSWDMNAFNRQARNFALQRGGDPGEIAGAALFLAGDASSYTTGALLRVDGGYLEPAATGRGS
jgi:NAD(P)-dependent dehydrogenase (short-subunit alcohol dehydrogenase family)